MRLDLENSQWSLLLALLSLVEDSELLENGTRERVKRLKTEISYKLQEKEQ